MPYQIVKRGGKFLTVNKETGNVKGTHDSMEKAKSQMHLLYGVEHGWKPTGKPAKKSKKNLARFYK